MSNLESWFLFFFIYFFNKIFIYLLRLLCLNFFFIESYVFIFLVVVLAKYNGGFLWKRNSVHVYFFSFFLHLVSVFFKYSKVLQIGCLVDIFVVDFPSFFNRFFITYSFLSLNLSFRFFFKNFISVFSLVPSLYFFYSNSCWLEREIWDLFGIRFFMHFDLRRILLDYGFLGHPLLKNFPLVGYLESRYDDSLHL